MNQPTWEDWGIYLLALTVWREARGASVPAQLAVAFSIKNRVERASWWGHDYQSVLTKKWQYSSIAAPGDPQLTNWPASEEEFKPFLQIAYDVVSGASKINPAPMADSYFDKSIPDPKWATPETFICQIGRLKFYNTGHDHETQVYQHIVGSVMDTGKVG